MEDDDTESVDSSSTVHSLTSVIDHVEDCIRRLEVAEGSAYLQFSGPKAEEGPRYALWAKHGIKEQYPIEQLESLLQMLATEERSEPWFKWLTWVLFGERT